MPRKHWRDFPPALRAKLTAKDIQETEEVYERWNQQRLKEMERLHMTEVEYTKYMATLCGELWGTGEEDAQDRLPR